jgi:predicted RNA-binding protein with PIN domain
MRWLIDGYNVLIGNDRGWDDSVRSRFGAEVAGYFAGKQVEVTIVYDSRESPGIQRRSLSSSCSEIYVADADCYLIEVVERSDHPREISLVTDDREIRAAVRLRRPRLISTGDFLGLLKLPPPPEREEEKPERDTPDDIERYLRIFGE